MSTTDNAFSATLEPIDTPKTTLKQRWWHIMDNWKVGIVPLPLFLLAGGLIALDCLGGKLPSDIVVMVATLAFFGFACGEFGKRLPVLGKLGAAAICATFIPSALVHYGLLPDVVIESTTKFYKSTNILYLYLLHHCRQHHEYEPHHADSGLSEDLLPDAVRRSGRHAGGHRRRHAAGHGAVPGVLLYRAADYGRRRGRGAIPLSMGYAALMHMEQGVALGRVLPMVMLGSLTAIVISGCLNQLGKRFPHLTGEGQLMPNRSHETRSLSESEGVSGKTDVGTLASGALLAVLLYMMGMLGHKLIGLPAPVGMLFLAVLLKLANVVSPRLQEGSQMVYKFFRTAVTYPILFAVGVAITPWQELVNAFTLTNLLVIVSTVSALVATGFLVGKKIGMHPIDVAIVSCCQSGQGGTGDVAILTAGNRMSLMPFAQIATRIGGAINVSLGLLFLSHYLA